MRKLILLLAAKYADRQAKELYSDGYTTSGIDFEMISTRLRRMASGGPVW